MACQAPLSMGLSRQEYWGGLPCPPPGDLPDPGMDPESPVLQADSLPLSHQGSPALPFYNSIKHGIFVVITASCFLRVYTNFDSFRSPYGSGFRSTAYVCSRWMLINIESSCQLEILRDHGSIVGTRNLGWSLRQ